MPGKKLPRENLLEFFELRPFSKRWDAFKFPDEELGSLQMEIMWNPSRHPVIPGTYGIRKMRYAPVSWRRGKSGSLRVCYVYFQRLGVVLLLIVYAKHELEDISESVKRQLNAAIAGAEAELERIYVKEITNGKGKQ